MHFAFFYLYICVSSLGTFPIDLTKTRLQVQGPSHCMEVRYRGMFHALRRIGQEEGIRALYSGWVCVWAVTEENSSGQECGLQCCLRASS